MATAAEFSVTPQLRDRVARSNATPRNGLEPASASAHRKILWMVCGGSRMHRHIESPATRFGGPQVHWHIEKAYGWFVGVRECIGTSKVLQHGLESTSVHWHVEKAYRWFVGVHECIGTSKVLQHGLGVRECIGTSKRPIDGLWGSASASAHRKSCSTVWQSTGASAHRKGLRNGLAVREPSAH